MFNLTYELNVKLDTDFVFVYTNMAGKERQNLVGKNTDIKLIKTSKEFKKKNPIRINYFEFKKPS